VTGYVLKVPKSETPTEENTMSAPTASTATLIAAYRDAVEFGLLALAEGDLEAGVAGGLDRQHAAHTLTEHGQGWVVLLLRKEHMERALCAALGDDTDDLRAATAAVDKVLARCA
jgi:hypothetical protein